MSQPTDASNHTSRGLMFTFIRRPAPVSQATFGSAGLEVRVEKAWCRVHRVKDRCWRKRPVV